MNSENQIPNDGGPAFPVVGQSWTQYGATLRDYFAARAMQALIQAEPDSENSDIALMSYRIADEMLAARNKHT